MHYDNNIKFFPIVHSIKSNLVPLYTKQFAVVVAVVVLLSFVVVEKATTEKVLANWRKMCVVVYFLFNRENDRKSFSFFYCIFHTDLLKNVCSCSLTLSLLVNTTAPPNGTANNSLLFVSISKTTIIKYERMLVLVYGLLYEQ